MNAGLRNYIHPAAAACGCATTPIQPVLAAAARSSRSSAANLLQAAPAAPSSAIARSVLDRSWALKSPIACHLVLEKSLQLRGRRPAHLRHRSQRVGQFLGVEVSLLPRHFLIEASLICGGRRVAHFRVRPQLSERLLGLIAAARRPTSLSRRVCSDFVGCLRSLASRCSVAASACASWSASRVVGGARGRSRPAAAGGASARPSGVDVAVAVVVVLSLFTSGGRRHALELALRQRECSRGCCAATARAAPAPNARAAALPGG
jgi:hypothetical protein